MSSPAADGRPRRQTLRISGAHSSPLTGAAIVHRELAARIDRHLPETDVRDEFVLGAPLAQRVLGRRGAPVADVCVTTSTPLPLRPRAHTIIPIVYDVRWRWTRGALARWYRHLDLIRSAHAAGHVVTISHTVAEQLRALRVLRNREVTVLTLGPGQLQDIAPRKVAPRDPSVLLIGRAAHKRNELAAQLLANIPSVRSDHRIVAISVSPTTEEILRSAFRPEQLAIHANLDQAGFVELVSSTRSYVALGFSEGFGFPYVEAAYLGCDVIAPRQSLTLEVLGEDAVLLNSADPSPEELADALDAWETERVGRLHQRAVTRDWDRAAQQLADVVRRFPGSR